MDEWMDEWMDGWMDGMVFCAIIVWYNQEIKTPSTTNVNCA